MNTPLSAPDLDTGSYSAASRFIRVFVFMLCLIPVIGVVSPRALAFLPAVLGLIGYIGFWRLDGKRPAINKIAAAIILSLLALQGASIFWSYDPDNSLDRFGKIALVLFPSILLLSVVILKKDILAPFFARYFLCALAVAAVICLSDHLSDGWIYDLSRDRGEDAPGFNFSWLNRAVIILSLCVLPALVVFRYLLSKEKMHILFFGIFAAAIAWLMMITHSQSAHFTLMVGFLFYFLFPARLKPLWIGLWAVMAVLLLSAPWLSQYMFKTLPPMVSGISWFENGYALSRFEIWDFISRYTLQSPFYGYGLESTEMIKDFDSQILYFEANHVLHPHNFALQFWIEYGVMGPLFLSVVFALLLASIWREGGRRAGFILSVFLSFIATATTSYGIWQSWFLGAALILFVYTVLAGALIKGDEAEPVPPSAL